MTKEKVIDVFRRALACEDDQRITLEECRGKVCPECEYNVTRDEKVAAMQEAVRLLGGDL